MQKIILDFTGCKYFMQVHERLARLSKNNV